MSAKIGRGPRGGAATAAGRMVGTQGSAETLNGDPSLRTAVVPCLACVVGAVVLAMVRLQNSQGDRFVCNYEKQNNQLAGYIYAFSLGSLFCFLVTHLVRMWGLKDQSTLFGDVKRVIIASFAVSFIQFITTFSDFVDSRGCINIFGVVTGSAMWIDWALTVPLMVYTYVTPIFGAPPSAGDAAAIGLSAVMILAGFLMNVSGISSFDTHCLFTISIAAFIASCYFINSSNRAMHDEAAENRAGVKRVLSLLFFVANPLYPVVYIAACTGVIDNSTTSILFNLLGLLTKGLFGIVIMELELHTFYRVETALSFELDAKMKRRDFLRYIFHELRIPLNSISMSVALCRKSTPEEISNYMDELSTYVDFMDSALERYMLTQKIQEGSFELAANPFRLDVLWQKIDTYADKFSRHRRVSVVRTTEGYATLPPVVEGDLKMINMALENMISHAVKRTADGGRIIIHIHDSTTALDHEEHKCRVRLEFEDFGPAMTQEEVDAIFLPFAHLMLGEISVQGGSNLGLFITKEVLTRYCSEFIVLAKEDGNGLNYKFDLRLSVAARTPSWPMDSPTSSKEGVRSRPGSPRSQPGTPTAAYNLQKMILAQADDMMNKDPKELKVLVVDDAGSNRKLLQRMLKQKNLSSDGAENGQIAVDMVESCAYDLVFMDYSMPVMNGVDATKAIRALGSTCCVVAVTGNAVDEDIQDFLDAGAQHCVVKPMTPAKLADILSCFSSRAIETASSQLCRLAAKNIAKIS